MKQTSLLYINPYLPGPITTSVNHDLRSCQSSQEVFSIRDFGTRPTELREHRGNVDTWGMHGVHGMHGNVAIFPCSVDFRCLC